MMSQYSLVAEIRPPCDRYPRRTIIPAHVKLLLDRSSKGYIGWWLVSCVLLRYSRSGICALVPARLA
jgi:hypothetical protein